MKAVLFTYRKTIRTMPATFDRVRAEVMRRFEDAAVVMADSPEDLVTGARKMGQPGLVLSAGGDGLLRDLVNLYCGEQPIATQAEYRHLSPTSCPDRGSPIFGIIPMGTGNETARGLGIPLDPVGAIPSPTSKRALAFAGQLEIKKGFVSMEREIYPQGAPVQFVNSAGTGIDSATVKARNAFSHFRINHYFFTFIFGVLPWLTPFSVRVRSGDRLLYEGNSFWVIALRGRFVGKGILLDPSADFRKPELRLLVVKGASRLSILRSLPSVLGGHAIQSPLVECFCGESFQLDFAKPRLISIDGDIAGTAEIIRIMVGPRLQFLLPAKDRSASTETPPKNDR